MARGQTPAEAQKREKVKPVEFFQANWQWLAVGACVFASLFFLARLTYQRLAGKSEKGCGGCGSCGGSASANAGSTKTSHLMQIEIKKKSFPS